MTTDSTLAVGLIYGSSRTGRYCDRVAQWTARAVENRGGFRVCRIDPRTLNLSRHHEVLEDEQLVSVLTTMAGADAFVIVAPEYNHSYPAPLKLLIDASGDSWQAKPVGLVTYGGYSGGLRAQEQLRQVLVELHAMTVRDAVCLPNVWHQFDENGELRDPRPIEQAMSLMLARLGWWASALRGARSSRPYQEAAA